jgi:hypothetical protein
MKVHIWGRRRCLVIQVAENCQELEEAGYEIFAILSQLNQGPGVEVDIIYRKDKV